MEDCLVHTLNYPIVPLPWHYFSFFHVRKHASLYMFFRYFWVILGIHAESPYNGFSNQSPYSPSHVFLHTLLLQFDYFLGILQLLGFLPPRILTFFCTHITLCSFFLYFLQNVFSHIWWPVSWFSTFTTLKRHILCTFKISPKIINVLGEFQPAYRK